MKIISNEIPVITSSPLMPVDSEIKKPAYDPVNKAITGRIKKKKKELLILLSTLHIQQVARTTLRH